MAAARSRRGGQPPQVARVQSAHHHEYLPGQRADAAVYEAKSLGRNKVIAKAA